MNWDWNSRIVEYQKITKRNEEMTKEIYNI